MGQRLRLLVERLRNQHGPFFVARLALRVGFPLEDENVPDSVENEEELRRACASLGVDSTKVSG